MTKGPEFYDDEHVFATYMQRRQRADNPNNTLEKPIVWELIGDVRGQSILDLGCGDGTFGVELRAAGCATYTGIEASDRMIERAEAHLKDVDSAFLHRAPIEDWTYPAASFDLVVSRLALHYISDIQRTFEQVYYTLKPGGHFVFSVEHPVITSCNRAVEDTGIRMDWIVDDYFEVGERNVKWMGSEVIKYHRTLENYFLGLQSAGLTVQSLRESCPQPALFSDEDLYTRRKRIPLFLLLKAQRPV